MGENGIKVIRPIGTIREYNRVSIEVNLIEIRKGEPRYDIRKYEAGEHRSRGISLDEEAARNLYHILREEFCAEDEDVPDDAGRDELYNILAAVRTVVAEYEGEPTYMVFTNDTLKEMCDKLPKDMDELMEIKGVGPSKCSRYGQEFLTAISNFLKREKVKRKK